MISVRGHRPKFVELLTDERLNSRAVGLASRPLPAVLLAPSRLDTSSSLCRASARWVVGWVGGGRWGVDFRTRSEYAGCMTTTAFRTTTRRSSDLSKHSAEVFAEAEDHPVTVTRRDGEDLVLMSRREAEGRNRMLEFAAQLIGVAVDDDGPLAERMSKPFPWMLALSEQDRENCAQNLVDAARASFSTDQPHRVLAEVNAWRETATALAAGLGGDDVEWLDDDSDAAVVERP